MGDKAEFHELFVASQRRLFAYILTVLPRIEDAREVFQNTCVVILNKSDQYVPGTDFARWACQIAHFEICNYRRKRQRELLVLDSQVLDSLALKQFQDWDEADRRQAALQRCLGRLSEADRQLIEARYRRNIPARQLAAELSRPEDTVYKALQRIRHRLQRCIEASLRIEEHANGE
jgi:RNA polymerase sigma-70 factor (ECF subfamily)